jgi:hypothetical protein
MLGTLSQFPESVQCDNYYLYKRTPFQKMTKFDHQNELQNLLSGMHNYFILYISIIDIVEP